MEMIAKGHKGSNGAKHEDTQQSFHPNGRPIKLGLKRPERNDNLIFEDIFPNTSLGKLLGGLVVSFLIKQEHRIGWARKSACDDPDHLRPYPNETVASHQWGVAFLIMTISRHPDFIEEMPVFDMCRAYEMAMIHDVPELVTGDITPVDGITAEEKHKLESEAMVEILGCFPQEVASVLHQTYNNYEDRQCKESKFVKDCDKLDFMIHAFLLEREGFTGYSEFYENSKSSGFSTKIGSELAEMLVRTRNSLAEAQLLYKKAC